MTASVNAYKETLLLELFPPKPSNLLFDKEISRGAYGVVFQGQFGDRPVAVKKLHQLLFEGALGQDEMRTMLIEFKKEADMLARVRHAYVVESLGAFFDKDTGEPVLVMELMAIDLRSLLSTSKGTLKVAKQFQICLQIALGLQYLHHLSPPLAHRDLNDKNILLAEDGTAKIGDLGQSKYKDMKQIYFGSRAPGNLLFMPPEATSDNPHYTESVDIFSLGVLAVEVATQSEPSPSVHGIGVVPEVERRASDLKKMKDDHPLKPLVLKCLKNDYKERPNIDHVVSEIVGCYSETFSGIANFKEVSALKQKLEAVEEELEELKTTCGEKLEKLEEELETAKEDISLKDQYLLMIGKELEDMKERCHHLEIQLKLNKEDFAQERSDRASAAGRYAEKEEKLEKTIQNLQNELEFLKSSRQSTGIQ